LFWQCLHWSAAKTDTDTHAKTLTTSTNQNAKSPSVCSRSNALSIWWPLSWRNKLMQQNQPSQQLSSEEIEVRVWGFVVIMITMILAGIVFALLYSVTFVTQPIKSMAPIDQAYTKMLNDIVLLIVGGIGGIVGKRAVSTAAKAFTPQPPQQPMCQPMMGGYGQSSYAPPQSAYGLPSQPFGAMPVWQNPDLDESWTPGPPPTTPPDHQEPEEDRAEIAAARKEAA
jgi:hypothetical protein